MSSDKSYEYLTIVKIYHTNQPILIAFDVEYYPIMV